MSRTIFNTNKHYPRLQDTFLGRIVTTLPGLRRLEWQQGHIFIQQAWSRVGSKHQIYDDLVANEGLRRLGNGTWNLLPIPSSLNNWLGRPGNEVAAQVFASLWYSAITYSPLHAYEALTSE